MFSPTSIILVPTQACNLRCPHCFVAREGGPLDADKAVAFLKAAAEAGIDRLGYSGGEPFLRPDFLAATVRAAVDSGFLFDRLMTNGAWFASEDQLGRTLGELYDAGYDGRIGLSYDCFHGQDAATAAIFAEAVFDVWKDRAVLELASVRAALPGDTRRTLAMLEDLASRLGAETVSDADAGASDGLPLPRALRFRAPLVDAAVVYGNGTDEVAVSWIAQTAADYAHPDNWQADAWFDEDYCEGPGNVLYVHANGDVAACCGYANEERSLVVGNVNDDGFGRIMENAKSSGFLKTVYETGLRATALSLEARGHRFPGKGRTANTCMFCRYLMDLDEGRQGT